MDRSISRRTNLTWTGFRRLVVVAGFGVAIAMSIAPVQGQEPCGSPAVIYPFPYTDVGSVGTAFCPGIMEAYVTGVSKGTAPTTFSPNNTVTRVQMTTFLQRSLDQGLARTNRRAALRRWWTPQNTGAMQTIAVGGSPSFCETDGENIWTSTFGSVVQVQASTGKVVGTWDFAGNSYPVVVASGKVFVTGYVTPGELYVIDPTQAPGPITVAAPAIGGKPAGIAFDGTNVWTANNASSVSIIEPHAPYTVTPVTTGFLVPAGILYDGANIWVTDYTAGTLLKLDAAGAILKTVTVGSGPQYPVFDGANIWVPNQSSNSISVVSVSTGTVIATIGSDASNQLNGPVSASFDGERILVTNQGGNSVTVFKAADLSFIANVSTGGNSPGVGCSDGINFFVPSANTGNLLRF
jgi:YVTN family beta-propeller protein